MTESLTLTGRCLCGAVTFEARDVQPNHHACHCTMCRRWSGSPFFGIHTGDVEFSGGDNIIRFDSSDWAARGFCATCGTNLFYYLKPKDSFSICAGTFDDQSAFKLTSEIFIDHKPDGYDFAGDLPTMTEAETLAKYRTADT